MSIFTLCLRSLFIGTFLLVAQAALATIEVIGTTPTSLNDCDGTITLIAVGSAGPFKVIALGSVYHVQENVDGEYTIPDLCAGAYTIKVFNRFGCEKTINATIEKITCPTITLEDIEDAITHPTTCGGSDGEIYFRFGGTTGGTEPYSWLWGNGSTNSRLSFVTSGTYTLTITDAVGCTGVFDFTLTGQDEPEIVFEDIAPACEGDNNGQIVVFASQEGGGAVNFQWSAGDVIFQDNVSSRVGNLPPGTHTVTITNTNMNCSIVRNYEVTDISASIPLSVNAIKSNTCPENASGSIQLQITGGVPNPDFVENNNPYNVVWAHGVVSNTQLNNLSAGNYCVTVTDFCGAMVSQCFDITIDPNDVFDVTPSYSNASETINGGIILEATTQGTFSYLWNTGATSNSITNLLPGSYTVTVTNESGCSIVRTYEIEECANVPPIDVIILGGDALDAMSDLEFQILVKQDDGSFGANIPPNYSITWHSPDDEQLGTGGSLILNNTYSEDRVNVRIANGCSSKVFTKNILKCNTSISSQLESIFIVHRNQPCTGLTDGSVTLALPYIEGVEGSVVLNNDLHYPLALQGNILTTSIGGLSGNESYNLNITIGNCTYNFDFILGEKLPELEYQSIDEDNGICYYSGVCDDMPLSTGGEGLIESPATFNWWGTTDNCKTPLNCGDNIVRGYKQFSKEWARGYEYDIILNNARNSPDYGDYYIENFIGTFYSGALGRECDKVRYCRGSLKFIKWGPLRSLTDPRGIINPLGSNCYRVNCISPFKTDYTVCSDYKKGILGEIPIEDNCIHQRANIYALYLNRSFLIDNYGELFTMSTLNDFLEQHKNDPKSKCASVTSCLTDFSYISDNLATINCGTVLCHGLSCNTIIENDKAFAICPTLGIIGDCKSSVLVPLDNFVVRPILNPEEELLSKIVDDNYQNEELINFGIAQSIEAINPQGLVKSDSTLLYYNFDPYPGTYKDPKDTLLNTEFFVEDWDYEYMTYVEQGLLGKESNLIFEDSITFWSKK